MHLLKVLIIIFISTCTLPSIYGSPREITSTRLINVRSSTGYTASTFEIHSALHDTSTLMAKKLNIPIYDNLPGNRINLPIADTPNKRKSQYSKISKETLTKRPKIRKSFSDVAQSIKKEPKTSNTPTQEIVFIDLE
jgi:hypothetical protein